MACNKNHDSVQSAMIDLPIDQGREGRHKCAACAYEQGLKDGSNLVTSIDLEDLFDNLEESQARNQRHKSPHAAYAKGYLDGVKSYYEE